MAGGAGNIGSAGGMGNASAQPQGGPSFAQPYMNNLGGGMGGGQQSSGFGPGVNNFGSGYGGSPFGMQQQQPMQNPFGQMGALSSPGYGAAEFQQQQRGVLGQGGQQMGQRPAFLDNPDFQAYQKQEQDLGRQMNEYMQKAPMYQQMQELQGKMRGFQQPQQGQMQNPYGNIDQMQQQRNMQDQARQQSAWQQATQDDMRAAVMPQQPDPGMMDALTLYTPGTYGNQRIDNRMGMPDYGSENVAPEFGNFGERRMGGGFGRRGMGGGYGRQMPQQAMGLQGLYSMLQGRRGGPFGGY